MNGSLGAGRGGGQLGGGGGATEVAGISGVASADLWLAGDYVDPGGRYPFAEYWDGNAWTIVSVPHPKDVSQVSSLATKGVSAASDGSAFIVGWYQPDTSAPVQKTFADIRC